MRALPATFRPTLGALKALAVTAFIAIMYTGNFAVLDYQRMLVHGTNVGASYLLAAVATACFTTCLLLVSYGDAMKRRSMWQIMGLMVVSTFLFAMGIATLIVAGMEAHLIWN